MPSGVVTLSEVHSWRQAPRADFAVIGDPVAHSLSPIMHAAAYRLLGLDKTYVAIHVPVGEVTDALDHLAVLGYQGVNVTVPHKGEALAWCGQADGFSRRVGAVNTIALADRAGINTDGPGFLDSLADLGLTPGRALILGAGGSARSLAWALSEAGWELAIYNRTASKAEDLVVGLGIDAPILAEPDIVHFDLIVNTTSASLLGDRLDVRWSGESPTMATKPRVAYDLMYSRVPSAFLREAAEAGVRAVDGVGMLVAQGARSLEWWLGVSAPREAMREAVIACL